MRRPLKDITVFVSSTSKDLRDYRAVAQQVILDLHWVPEMMEHFGAQPGQTIESCYSKLDRCDVMLLLVAFRRGWVPTVEQGGNGQDSITALELAHARSRSIPVLVLMARDTWPGSEWEDETEGRQWIRTFRDGLNTIADWFGPEPHDDQRLPTFRALLKQTLLAQKERLLNRQETRLQGSEGVEFFESTCSELLTGTNVPVVGPGIYAGGALSAETLISALVQGVWPGAEQRGEILSLATAAEVRERWARSRTAFLDQLKAILQKHSSQQGQVHLLELLRHVTPLSLIVSINYDNLLEEMLAQAGRTPVVVAHVVRSLDNLHDGKIVVLRPGQQPEICAANNLHIVPGECVIYKPQGSPFIHDLLEPELEIDTVVMTETDHLTFLQRLHSKETGVPAPFARRFRHSPLLFIGYEMDVWQYRLMMQLFQAAGREAAYASTVAVRIPSTPIEEVAWKRLNADLLHMKPNDFAMKAFQNVQTVR